MGWLQARFDLDIFTPSRLALESKAFTTLLTLSGRKHGCHDFTLEGVKVTRPSF